MISLVNKLNRSISRQFSIVIIANFIILLLGNSFLSYYQSKLEQRYFTDVQHLIDKEKVLTCIASNYSEIVIHVRGYLAYHEESERKSALEAVTKFHTSEQWFQKLNASKKEKKMVQDLHEFVDQYTQQFFPQAIALIEAGDWAGINRLAKQHAIPQVNQFVTYTQNFVTASVDKRDELHKEYLNQVQEIQLYQVCLIAILLTLCLLVILILTKRIGQPLQELSATAQALKVGNYDVQFNHLDRLDEIGILSRTLKEMVANIKRNEETLSAYNEELVAQQDELIDREKKLLVSLDEIQRNKNMFENLGKFNLSLSTIMSKQVLLDQVLARLSQMYRMDKALLAIYQSTGEYASIGVLDSHIKRYLAVVNEGIIVRLLETKQPYIVKREATDEEKGYHDQLKAEDLYVPIFASDESLVAIFICTRVGQSFSENELNDMSSLLSRIALPIEKINLFEITEQQRLINQLVIDNVNQGIQLIDLEGKQRHVNNKLCHFLGCNHSDDMENATLDQWLHEFMLYIEEPKPYREFIVRMVSESTSEDYTYRYQVKKPHSKMIEVYAKPIEHEGYKIGILLVHRDITAEFEIDQMKSELVSTVSHELRTPLSSVLGFTELMLTKTLSPERQKRYVQTIHKEALRLTRLINDFLDIQRMESGKQHYEMKPLRLATIIETTVSTFRLNHLTHTFEIELETNADCTDGDEEKLTQVLINLLNNAVKFSPQGGTIRIKLSQLPDQHIQLEITDEGLGIPEHELPKLFQKFHRVNYADGTKINGTGLGLAICKEIVDAHQGIISCVSKLGSGSTFTIVLPLSESSCTVDFSSSVLDDHDYLPVINVAAPLILIVEDDASHASWMAEKLQAEGYHTRQVSNGEKGVLAAKQKLPDLIIVDLKLDDTMNGWQMIEQLHNDPATKSIPIIISTALDHSNTPMDYKNHYPTIKQYLTKPYSPEQLVATVGDSLSDK